MANMIGIDVSKYQKNIDWSKVDASGIDFALIRIGMGNVLSQVDPYFKTNVEQSLAHGLFVGGYYFGYAVSVEDAQKEAEICNQLLQQYKGKLLFPIAYDFEYNSVDYFKKIKGRIPTNAEIDSFASAFCERLNSYGWFVNNYTNIDYYRSGKFTNTVKKYDVWLADYNGAPDYPCYIQQTGSKGAVNGIVGNVDMNICFRDYPTMIKAKGYNGYPKPQITVVDIDTTMDITFPFGSYYTIKTVSPTPVKLTYGTSNVVSIVPFPRNGNEQLFAIVAIGKSGLITGIYTATGDEQPTKRLKFIVK